MKHNIETSYSDINTPNFKIIDINFSNNKRKRKIIDSLRIKDLRPTLNLQEKSIPLKWLITLTATSELCNIGTIILIVYYLLPW